MSLYYKVAGILVLSMSELNLNYCFERINHGRKLGRDGRRKKDLIQQLFPQEF